MGRGNVRRNRHEVPGGRRTARGRRGPGRLVRLYRHRGRLRQAHRGGGIPAPGTRRSRHQGRKVPGGARTSGRCLDRP
nr:hypothetical protein [Arthrobacter sp. B3I9]